MSRICRLLPLLCLLLLAVPVQSREWTGVGFYNPPTALCDQTDLGVSIRLTRSAIDSIGRSFSRHNYEVIQHADELLRSGSFGEDRKQAEVTARRFFQLHCWTGMGTISNLTGIQGGVARMEGPGHFQPMIDSYFNGAMYPLRHVNVAQLGEDHFCLRYDIPKNYEERFQYGEITVLVRSDEIKNRRGEKSRVLSREWVTADGDKVELLYEKHFTGRVKLETIEDRGHRLRLITFYDMDGLYVRKYGTHHMGAMVIWHSDLKPGEIPRDFRIGGAAYFPKIDIDLPWFLPSLGLDDLRDFAFPPPLMASQFFLNPDLLPEWIGFNPAGRLKDWDSVGPRPKILEERFPDL